MVPKLLLPHDQFRELVLSHARRGSLVFSGNSTSHPLYFLLLFFFFLNSIIFHVSVRGERKLISRVSSRFVGRVRDLSPVTSLICSSRFDFEESILSIIRSESKCNCIFYFCNRKKGVCVFLTKIRY